MAADRPVRPPRLLEGPPVALPPLLDTVGERWWRTRPRTRVALVAAAVLVVVAAGAGHVASSPWGPPVTVLVAADDLDIGTRLTSADVRRADWPADLVPPDPLEAPAGTLLTPVPAGSVLSQRHVADGGIGAALPPGQVAVPLPVELLPDVPPGTRLDLVNAGPDAEGAVVSRGALVLAADGAHLWVVVERPTAAAVAAAGAAGRLTGVVLPSDP